MSTAMTGSGAADQFDVVEGIETATPAGQHAWGQVQCPAF